VNGRSPISPDVLWIIVIVFAVAYFASFWPRRHNALHNFKWMIVAGTVGFIEYLIFQTNGWNGPAKWGIIIFSVIVLYRSRPSQSNRRISNAVRRRVVADWQRKTGEKFNSRKYELDHIIPFSRGGGHTFDNLRVIEKSRNRSKGAQLPRWDIVGRMYRRIFHW
jgi:hypothetical protein